MIFIYDRNENQIDNLDIIPIFTRELGKYNTLEFQSSREYEKGYRIVYFFDNKAYEFIITDTIYERTNGVIHSYFCQDSIIELKGNLIQDKRPNGSYKVALQSILSDTRWELKFSGISENYTQKNSFYRINTLEAFEKVINEYDIEWETQFEYLDQNITRRVIHIRKIGSSANGRLEFGKNITKFTRIISPEPVTTALYGYGKGEEKESGGFGRRLDFSSINNNKEYVEDIEALKKYGIGSGENKFHYYDIVIFDNVEDKNELLRLTKKELSLRNKPNVEYTVNASNIGIDCVFGDDVAVIDEEINFRANQRIIKIVYEGDNVEFTFGKTTSKFTDSVKNQISNNNQTIKEEISTLMDAAIKNASIKFFNQDSYTYDLKVGNEYNLAAGLYSFNKPIDQSPDKATYVGGGQVLISNEKGTDNEWIWKSAITGDGIHGSSIISNSITVNQLSSDVGQFLDLSSNESIITTVSNSELFVTRDSGNAMTENISSVMQTADEIVTRFESYTANNDAKIEGIDETVTRFSTIISEGQHGINISKEGSEFNINIDNDSLDIRNGNNVVAYASESQFYGSKIEILEELIFDDIRFVKRKSGNKSLIKFRR